MTRFVLSLSVALTIATAIPQALAGTYAVGTCRPNLQSYSTITAAVSSVPAGSTILVCPGTYAEQVSINQPLTLQGIASPSGNSGRAIITVPGEAAGNPQLQVNSQSEILIVPSVAAQVLVQNVNPPGQVIITNLTVDGSGSQVVSCGDPTDPNAGANVVGIFYASGTSGIVDRTTVRHQNTGGDCGFAIVIENESATVQAVKVTNNSVHHSDNGIVTGTQGDPQTLTTTLAGNSIANVSPFGLGSAILAFNAATIYRNFITASPGITGSGSAVSISRNLLADDSYGLALNAGTLATGNEISNPSSYAIAFPNAIGGVNGAIADSNTIMNAPSAAIEFYCLAAGATRNIINDAKIGVDQASNTALVSGNTFDNVDTIKTVCN